MSYELMLKPLSGTYSKSSLDGVPIILRCLPWSGDTHGERFPVNGEHVLMEFIALTQASCYGFAVKYGLLDNDLTKRAYVVDPPIRRTRDGIMFNDPPRTLDRAFFWHYETIDDWMKEVKDLRMIVHLHQALQTAMQTEQDFDGLATDDPLESLKKLLIIEGEHWVCVKPDWHREDVPHHEVIPRVSVSDSIIDVGLRLLECFFRLEQALGNKPRGSPETPLEQVRLIPTRVGNSLNAVIVCPSLLSYLWRSALNLVTQKTIVQSCSWCGVFHIRKHAAPKKGNTKCFCSPACRAKSYRAKVTA